MATCILTTLRKLVIKIMGYIRTTLCETEITAGVNTCRLVDYLLLEDANGVTWYVTIGDDGALTSTIETGATGNTSYYLQDDDGVQYSVTIDIDGSIITTEAETGAEDQTIVPIFLQSDNYVFWKLFITTNGNIETRMV